MQVTSKGGKSNATPNQLFWLFKLVRRRFTHNQIEKAAASVIIGMAIDIRKTGIGNCPEEAKRQLVAVMRSYFPDWTIDELNLAFIPSAKKPDHKPAAAPKPKPTVEQAVEQAIDDIEGSDNAKTEDEDDVDDVEHEDDNGIIDQPGSPYDDLPQGMKDRLKQIDSLLKSKLKIQQQQAAEGTTTTAPATEPEAEEPDEPVVKVDVPTELLPSDFIVPPGFDHWLALAKAGLNFMLCGPAGCGKTYSAIMIAKCLGKEYYDCTLSGGVRYNQVFGSTHIVNGESVWLPADLLKNVQKPWVIIINEVLAADADITIGLNPLLEPSQRFIMTPGGRIDVHPDCVFIATANNKGRAQSRGYIGAQIQDGSILDRFGIKFDVDYDEQVELQVARQYVNKQTAKRLISKLKNLRDKLRQNEINFDPSTRRLVMCCRQIKEAKIDKDVAFETTFLTSLSKAERQTIGM